MCIVSACIVMTSATWWVTRRTEADTRRLKLATQKLALAALDDLVKRTSKAVARWLATVTRERVEKAESSHLGYGITPVSSLD